MNEQALKAVYNDMGFEGQGISYDQFIKTMSTNEEARKSVYSDMGFEGQGISYDQYESTLGFKKKDQTEPIPSDVSAGESLSPEDLSEEQRQSIEASITEAQKPVSPEEQYAASQEVVSETEQVKPTQATDIKEVVEVVEEDKAKRYKDLSDQTRESRYNELKNTYVEKYKADEETAALAASRFLRDESMSYAFDRLGLDADSDKEYRENIRQYYDLYQKENKEEKDLIELQRLDSEIAKLRDSQVGLVNPLTGNVDRDYTEEVKNLSDNIVIDNRNDFQKISDLQKKEYYTLSAIRDEYNNIVKKVAEENNVPLSEGSLIKDLNTGYLDERVNTMVNSDLMKNDPELQEKLLELKQDWLDHQISYDASTRALLLNEDPARVSRGIFGVPGPLGDTIIGDVEEAAESALSSAAEYFTEDFFGVEIASDRDYREAVVPVLQEAGVKLSEEQIQSGIPTFSEEFGGMMGQSMSIGAKIAIDAAVTKGALSAAGVPKIIASLGAAKNWSPKRIATMEKLYEGLVQSVAFEVASDETSAVMGAAEFGTAEGMEFLAKKLAGGKLGKFAGLMTRLGGRIVGGTVEEYAGDMAQNLSEFGISEQAFKETFGEGDEAWKKFFLTAAAAGIMGAPVEVMNTIKGDVENGTASPEVVELYNDLYDKKKEKPISDLTAEDLTEDQKNLYESIPEERKEQFLEDIKESRYREEARANIAKRAKESIIRKVDFSDEKIAAEVLRIKEEEATQLAKETTNDKEEGEQVSGPIGEREKPGDIQLDETSEEETTAGGVLQEEVKEYAKEKGIESEEDIQELQELADFTQEKQQEEAKAAEEAKRLAAEEERKRKEEEVRAKKAKAAAEKERLRKEQEEARLAEEKRKEEEAAETARIAEEKRKAEAKSEPVKRGRVETPGQVKEGKVGERLPTEETPYNVYQKSNGEITLELNTNADVTFPMNNPDTYFDTKYFDWTNNVVFIKNRGSVKGVAMTKSPVLDKDGNVIERGKIKFIPEKEFRNEIEETSTEIKPDNDSEKSVEKTKIIEDTKIEEVKKDVSFKSEPSKSAIYHAEDVGGTAYELDIESEEPIGLIQGFNLFGKPVYVGYKGDNRTRTSVSNFSGNLFSPQELKMLQEQEQKLKTQEEKNAKKYGSPFKNAKSSVVATESVSSNVATLIKALKNSLGMEGVNIFITTDQDLTDANFKKHGLFGNYSSVRSSKLSSLDKMEKGSTRKIKDGEHYIYIDSTLSPEQQAVVASHELGHILEKEVFDKADDSVKKSIKEEYDNWYASLTGKSIGDVISETRDVSIQEMLMPKDATRTYDPYSDSYISSFKEWFADNVSKYATTSAKPKNALESFFYDLYQNLKKIYNSFKKKNKTFPTMEKWLDSMYDTAKTEEVLNEFKSDSMAVSKDSKIEFLKSKGFTEQEAKAIAAEFEAKKKAEKVVKKETKKGQPIKKTVREKTGQTDTSPKVITTEAKALKEKYKNISKGQRATKAEIRNMQKDFRDFVRKHKDSINKLNNRLTTVLLNKSSSIKDQKTLDRALNAVEKVVTDSNYKYILNAVNPKNWKQKGSQPAKGKIDLKTQEFFKKVSEALTMTPEEASALRDKIEAKYKDINDISEADFVTLESLGFAGLESKPLESLEEMTQLIKKYEKEGRQTLKQLNAEKAQVYYQGVEDILDINSAGQERMGSNDLKNSRNSTRAKDVAKSSANWMKKNFNAGMAKNENWAGLMGLINRKQGESYIPSKKNEAIRKGVKESFIDPINEAESNKMRSMQKVLNKIREKQEEIFGKKHEKTNDFLQEQILVEDSKGNPIRIEGRELVMTRDKAMYIYNLTKDESLVPTLKKMQENKNTKALIDFALKLVNEDKKLKDYADWVHEDYYPSFYERINKEYRKQYNIDLPFNPDYSPIFRKDAVESEPNVLSFNGNIASTINGSLKERTSNTKELDLSRGLEGTMLRYADQMEHFINFTDIVKKLSRVFGNQDVKNSIEQFSGIAVNGVIDRFIKSFAGSYINNEAGLEWVQNLRKNFTTATLGLNATVYLKQLTSAPAYAVAEGVSTADYLKESGKMLTTKKGLEAMKEISNSDFIKDRKEMQGFDRDAVLSFERALSKGGTRLVSLRNKLMFMTKAGDVHAIILGGTPYYMAMKNKYIKQGMTETKAKEKAMLDFENATKSTQQSSNISELSDLQRGSEIAKLFTMFKTSPAQYFRKSSNAWRNLANKRGTMQDLKTIAMFQVVLPSLFTLASKGFMSDEDDIDDYKAAVALGNLQGLPFIGEITKFVIDLTEGKDYAGLELIPAFAGIEKAVRGIVKQSIKGEVETEDLLNDVLFPTLEGVSGLPLKNAKKLTIDNLDRISKIDSWEDLMKAIGYSDYALGNDNYDSSDSEGIAF